MTIPLLPFAHGQTRPQFESICAELGAPPYRARQIWNWLYGRFAAEWAEMKNLPESLRLDLARRFDLTPGRTILAQDENGAGSTTKLLVELRDGERIEEVCIPAKGRTTLCVSSQVGCRFHCAFCASGQAGLKRNLATGEIVGQIVSVARQLGAAPSHVVFMGMGEPFDNYEAVLAAIRIINDADGLAIGARRITISTCGVVPGIRQLAQEGLQVELSISLHAVDDNLRTRLMPVNRKYPLRDLLEACRAYAAATGRLITFEYTLIKGVNDRPADARALAQLLRPVHARVNLIPLSPVAEFNGCAPEQPAIRAFLAELEQARINATLRRSKGSRVNAACGQLRLAAAQQPHPINQP